MMLRSLAWARHTTRPTTVGLRRTTTTTTTCPHLQISPHHLAGPPVRCTTQRVVTQHVPASTKTIPGPSWLWLEPIYKPFRAYGRVQQRRPYMTQVVSALVIYLIGDLAAQSIGGNVNGSSSVAEEQHLQNIQSNDKSKTADRDHLAHPANIITAWATDRDWLRTGRALIIGSISCIPSYRWFLYLGNNFNYGSTALSLLTKVTINQVLFTPVFNTYFFGMQSLLSGASLSKTLERVSITVPVSWWNSCKIWPAVTAFSFAFIPVSFRMVFGGVVAVGWQCYLSLLNQRAENRDGVVGATIAEVKNERVEEGGIGFCGGQQQERGIESRYWQLLGNVNSEAAAIER